MLKFVLTEPLANSMRCVLSTAATFMHKHPNVRKLIYNVCINSSYAMEISLKYLNTEENFPLIELQKERGVIFFCLIA